MDKMSQIKEKVDILNRASKAYYQDAEEIMSNFEYDKIYDELIALEEETGIVLSNSPTQKVGYQILSSLPKERHPSRMLSLDKTKDREALKTWIGSHEGLLSWKLDGLTIVLTYEDGKLVKALTRGNGEIGEVITGNAKAFANVPISVPYKGKLVLRGEAVIKYSDFEKINANIPELDAKYKNPRNLCSGSVRQLDSKITAERNVNFYAFSLVEAEGVDFANSRENQMLWMKSIGFDIVDYRKVSAGTIIDAVEWFEQAIPESDVPSDGLVLTLDDIAYSRTLGTTAKFPRDSIAFKWRDQIAETTLKEMEWSASRTGLINPVAIFEPVELEGTTVSRASVHNISVMKDLKLGIGDTITVYKANMIIPQIAENLSGSNNIEIPRACPVCGQPTDIENETGVETLVCQNPECPAKQIKSFTLFVSRDAMNIDGLSEATIEKLIGRGFIKEFADLFHIEKYKAEIEELEGFGEKSFANLVAATDKAKNTTPERLLYSLGIPNIGVANAKLIAKACGRQWSKMIRLTKEELLTIDGIGEVMADCYVEFFRNPEKAKIVDDLEQIVNLDETVEVTDEFLGGMTFVITGSLERYENRDELKALIEKAGGKVAGSVSAKTSYLINNDLLSGSSKNKKAKELGVRIINEDTIKEWLEEGKVSQV
ncbi:MAG TPA: NAD-dependent DNA ligase LigA [Anaerovoracaceae bacterium]|nr:NAD-dependent DNA ligase LigA [Anaerovoracaceae bacterium]